ncbi:MAG: hypothetical protein ACFE7R_03485 [Candidatus Hodarchaeota archaeon]
MRRDQKRENNKDNSKDDKKRLSARIPITEWNDIERRMAIISRMTTEPIGKSSEGVNS